MVRRSYRARTYKHDGLESVEEPGKLLLALETEVPEVWKRGQGDRGTVLGEAALCLEEERLGRGKALG